MRLKQKFLKQQPLEKKNIISSQMATWIALEYIIRERFRQRLGYVEKSWGMDRSHKNCRLFISSDNVDIKPLESCNRKSAKTMRGTQ